MDEDRRTRTEYHYGATSRDEQLARVRTVLSSGALGAIGGTEAARFEQRAAAEIGRAGAVAVASATGGLELVLRALGVGPADEVIVPELSWVSVGAAAWAVGATVRVAPVTDRLTPGWEQLAPLITPQTRIVVLAHMRGMAATDTARIAAELHDRGIRLVEDCAQAWGVRVGGVDSVHVGNHGVAAVFSTQTYKLIATGEGGLVVADDPDLLTLIRALSGDTRVPTTRPLWRLNYRMSEVHAAIALPQLDRLDALVAQLIPLQRRIAAALAASPVVESVLPDPSGAGPASNGSLVGTWLQHPDLAAAAAATLWSGGIPCYQPGSDGDLHVARSWPAHPQPASLVDLRRYADVPVPLLPAEDHPAYLDTLRTLVASWETLPARPARAAPTTPPTTATGQ